VTKYNRLLFPILSEAQRQRFLVGRISQGFARLPVILTAIALLSLLGAVFIPDARFIPTSVYSAMKISFYLFWLMSLGAMGSIAFIGMNALSVQQDITFDLLNPRLIYLRIALGALFSLILTLPYGYVAFGHFLSALFAPEGQNTLSRGDALLLVVPFLLGFSTSLVIMILNRLLEAAQSFFGKTLITTKLPTSSAPSLSRKNSTHILAERSEPPGVGGPAKNMRKRKKSRI